MSTALIFRALADPTRRQILQELRSKEHSAGEITALFEITAPSVSRHLSILMGAGLVVSRRDGNRIYYRLEADALVQSLNEFMSAICPTQIVKRRRMDQQRSKGTRS